MGMFLDYDAQAIHDEIISRLQSAAGETLPEGDERRVFAEALTAYMLAEKSGVEDAARQKMLAYARGEVLDGLGALYGLERLEAQAATATLRFTLPAALTYAVTVPAGTVASTPDGLAFATAASATILAGETSVDVGAAATEPGSEYNGLVAGAVSTLMSALPYELQSVANVGTTGGGTDGEPDDDEGNELFRERILLAQNTVVTTGTRAAYIRAAKDADQAVADAAVADPDEGYVVNVYVVKSGGEQFGQSELAAILDACASDDVRPLCDRVSVSNAERVAYAVDATYTLPDGADDIDAEAVLAEYLEWQDETIGRDVQPQKLMALLFAAGAETVDVALPAHTAVGVCQVAKCTSSDLRRG